MQYDNGRGTAGRDEDDKDEGQGKNPNPSMLTEKVVLFNLSRLISLGS